MRKLTSADYRTMPWKNGGGVTTELAIAPSGATLDDFDWRISSAQVREAGPFSRFEGIDRSLAIDAGAGLLWRGESATHTLTPSTPPLAFLGEEAVHASLIDGPVIDFNIMTRRARWTHALQCLQLHGARELQRDADLLFVYCADGAEITCRAGTKHILLNARDAVFIDRADGDGMQVDAPLPARLFIVQLTYRGTANAE